MAYEGNNFLRGIDEKIEYTPEIIREYIRCRDDIIYFAEHYVKIISIDEGEILIPLRAYQKRILTAFTSGNKFIILAPRQIGKTVTTFIYILHYAIFNESKEIALLANKEPQAKEILDRIKFAYERLPLWMQQGVKEWNKKTVILENNSKIFIGTTGSSSIRGRSISLLYLDEFAHIPKHLSQEFMDSVFPTVSSSKTSKIIISSTPKGQNYFYDMWQGAVKNLNGFIPLKVHYTEVPGRDAKWKASEIRASGLRSFLQEQECCRSLSSRVRIKDGHRIFEETLDILEVIYEPHFEIDTPHGFVKFGGCVFKGRRECFEINLGNNKIVEATDNHPFVVDGKTILLKDLKVGDYLDTRSGKFQIYSIRYCGVHAVSDVLNVENPSKTFYVNDIVSHNCSFLGSSSTLIGSEFIEKMGYREPYEIKYSGNFDIYEKPDKDKRWEYVLGIDTAEGVGQNYSVIQVLKITNHHLIEQVATYRNNMISPYNFAQICIEISKYYHNALMMIENNNVGNTVCKHIWYDFDCENIVNTSGTELGIRSTKLTKTNALMLLKRYIESGYTKIRNKATVKEFITFVEKRDGVFGADNKEDTDDTVIAFMWGLFFLTTFYYNGSDELHMISDENKIETENKESTQEALKDSVINTEDSVPETTDNDVGSIMFTDNDEDIPEDFMENGIGTW